MKKLAVLNNLVELEMLKELLMDYDIQLIVKHQEAGDFMALYTGNTIFGIEVYVAKDQFEKAKELYKGFFKGDYVEVD